MADGQIKRNWAGAMVANRAGPACERLQEPGGCFAAGSVKRVETWKTRTVQREHLLAVAAASCGSSPGHLVHEGLEALHRNKAEVRISTIHKNHYI